VLYALMVFTLVWLFRRCEVRWLAFLQPQAH
jgi:histidine transport system permease protein